MESLNYKVRNFLRNVLYGGESDDSKTEAFDAILRALEEVSKTATRDEREYILSQISAVDIVDRYTVPLVKEMCTRFLERFDTYYGLDTEGDVLASDLDHAKLGIITPEFFGCQYLGEVNKDGKGSRDVWRGISYGPQCRVLFCFPVSLRNGVERWCTFLYDTGSKLNYVSPETYTRLGVDHMSASAKIPVRVNGIMTFAYSSDFEPRLKGINVLGDEFLSSFDCTFSLQYKGGRCTPMITPDGAPQPPS